MCNVKNNKHCLCVIKMKSKGLKEHLENSSTQHPSEDTLFHLIHIGRKPWSGRELAD